MNKHIRDAHKTTMTQEQCKELLWTVTVPGVGAIPLEEAASMTDRQLHLTWLRSCLYITDEEYQQEFKACDGKPLF